MRPLSLLLLALCTACAGRADSQATASGAAPFAITNVTVVSGTGAAPMPGMTVEVRDGRIRSITPSGAQPLAADLEVVDGAGQVLLPGFIDAHVHLATVERPDEITRAILRYTLYGGVTTVRDMGGNAPRVMELAARARRASMPRRSSPARGGSPTTTAPACATGRAAQR